MASHSNAQRRARVATTMFWRGGLIAVCGAVAVRWPADGLLLSIAGVGVLAIAFGSFDVAIALWRRKELGWWWALALHGVSSVAFGSISLVAMSVSQAMRTLLFAGWLALGGVLALAVGLIARGRGGVGLAGLSIFLASVAAVLLLLADLRMSAYVLLYAGAAYAALLGITEIGLGHWLRERGAAAGLDVQEAT